MVPSKLSAESENVLFEKLLPFVAQRVVQELVDQPMARVEQSEIRDGLGSVRELRIRSTLYESGFLVVVSADCSHVLFCKLKPVSEQQDPIEFLDEVDPIF